jgi:hypothetical protein
MFQLIIRAALLSAALALGACGGGSHSRGQFQGHVVGKAEDEIVSRVGKPDEMDGKDPAKPRWVYKGKTFDPDNFNQVDKTATIILEKGADGKLVGRDVLFGS